MKKRILAVGIAGSWALFGVLVQACGGDDSSTTDGGGGMDGTVNPGMDGSTGMDGNMDDTGMGMDGNTGNDGSTGMDGGGGGGPNPGKVNCGTMLDCDAGFNGCCVHFQNDGGQTYACLPQGQCGMGGVRWECDERADCMNNELCCVGSFQNATFKTCNNFCGNGSARACKSTNDCPDAGACNTYTCPGNVVVQACSKPNNCN